MDVGNHSKLAELEVVNVKHKVGHSLGVGVPVVCVRFRFTNRGDISAQVAVMPSTSDVPAASITRLTIYVLRMKKRPRKN